TRGLFRSDAGLLHSPRLARLPRLLPEEADRLDRPAHVGLAGEPNRLSFPPFPDERERLQRPDRHREALELRRRREVLRAREGDDRAGRAVSETAADVPEL